MERKLRSVGFVLILGATTVAGAADTAGTATDTSQLAPHAVRAYADPETGELVTPDGVEPTGLIGSGAAAEDAPLEVVPAPKGGVMVDLRGRFRHEMRASTVDGALSADCIPARSPP